MLLSHQIYRKEGNSSAKKKWGNKTPKEFVVIHIFTASITSFINLIDIIRYNRRFNKTVTFFRKSVTTIK